jgi:hypothetical protein
MKLIGSNYYGEFNKPPPWLTPVDHSGVSQRQLSF